MGYCYGRNGLCCDKCGTDERSADVRKRECPYTVLGASLRTIGGVRHKMRYCSPAALCRACYRELGGLRGVHGDECKNGAAASQAEADAIESGLLAGEMYVICGEGSGDGIPAGMVRVTFAGRYNPELRDEPKAVRLMPKADYDFRAKPRLSDYPQAIDPAELAPKSATGEVVTACDCGELEALEAAQETTSDAACSGCGSRIHRDGNGRWYVNGTGSDICQAGDGYGPHILAESLSGAAS